MKYVVIFSISFIFLISCSSDREVAAKFAPSNVKIMYDEDGTRYIVTHAIGDNYTVKILY